MAQYQDTHSLVKKNWRMGVRGTPMYRLTQRLKKVKLDLKSRSKATFGNFKTKLERNTDKLLYVEEKLIQSPNSARLNNWHYRLIKQREKMHIFNQKYWGKMARKEWLVNGDRNSHFFHQTIKTRKTRSRIVKLKDNSGVWVEEPVQIEQMFINDFTARIKSAQVSSTNIDMEMLNLVSAVDNDTLLQSI